MYKLDDVRSCPICNQELPQTPTKKSVCSILFQLKSIADKHVQSAPNSPWQPQCTFLPLLVQRVDPGSSCRDRITMSPAPRHRHSSRRNTRPPRCVLGDSSWEPSDWSDGLQITCQLMMCIWTLSGTARGINQTSGEMRQKEWGVCAQKYNFANGMTCIVMYMLDDVRSCPICNQELPQTPIKNGVCSILFQLKSIADKHVQSAPNSTQQPQCTFLPLLVQPVDPGSSFRDRITSNSLRTPWIA